MKKIKGHILMYSSSPNTLPCGNVLIPCVYDPFSGVVNMTRGSGGNFKLKSITVCEVGALVPNFLLTVCMKEKLDVK